MQIKELELENFKSFKHQKFTFNKGVTAITGPNGSGKSNVFDALIFVLGNNSSLKLRYKKISDLICRDQKEKYARVLLSFDDGTSIERTITEDVSVFRLNGKRTTQEAILSFMKELKISPDGHNLVQQGNNKKIIDMNESERKKLIEDIAQVSLFDEQREKSEKNLIFVRNKISEAKTIMEERKEILQNLEKEKTIAEEYLKVKEEETILKGVVLKKEKIAIEHDLTRTQKRIETLNRNIPEEQIKVKKLEQDIKESDNEIEKSKKHYMSELENHSKLDAEYKVYDYKINSLKSEIKELEDNIHSKNAKLNALNAISKLDNSELLNLENDLQTLKSKVDKYDLKKLEQEQQKANKAIEDIEKQISKYYNEYYDLKSKFSLRSEKEKELEQNKNKIKDLENKILDINEQLKELKDQEEELNKVKDQKDQLKSVIDDTNREIISYNDKISQNKYKIESCNNEIALLEKAQTVNSDIIIIENEKEADKLIEENLKKNIFGTFFFVLSKHYNDVKSNIIIKTISIENRLSIINKEIKDAEHKILNLEESLRLSKVNLLDFAKKQREIDNLYDSVQRRINNLKSLQNQVLYLQNQRKDLDDVSIEVSFDVSEQDISKLELKIAELNEQKNNIPKVNFDEYLKISQEYNKKIEYYQRLKEQKKQQEIEVELAKKEKITINEDLHLLEKDINDKKHKLNNLNESLTKFSETKKESESKLRLAEQNVITQENKAKQDLQDKNDSITRITVWTQEIDEQKKNLFLKDESLTKKIDEIKKYIELNNTISMELLEQEFIKNQTVPIKDLQNLYYDLLTKLNAFGNVNLKSIEDHKEYLEKYGTILQRIDELEKEMQEIKDKIKEIQAEKEQKFMVSFELINKNFSETLEKLGLGDLSLNIVKNDLDEISGVIIKSNKRGTISLSGGEKALVTISFLFSVLMLEPSMFYLLDEIDADLDYNNSEKIFNMLNDIAKNTQMLMITHNPVIVNKADNVIGVSKNAHGITAVFIKQTKDEESQQIL